MVKAEVRSTIKNFLNKYPQGSEYHDEVVDRAIERVINQLYTASFLRDPHSVNRYVKRFGGTTALTVNYDASAGIYYTTYPSGYSYVPLPDKASGIRRVTTVAQAGIRFFPMDQREMELVDDSVCVSGVSNKIGYVVTQDRIEYYDMTAAIATAGVRMDMLVPFSDYADTDEVLIPDIPGETGDSFVNMTLAILGVIVPQETKDDNVTTIQTKG